MVEMATLTYECGPVAYDDFPLSEKPVTILGVQYSTLHDLEELRDDVTSRVWFTYRKSFTAIGGTGPTSDTGWGCMLRCGQMMLAQGLILRHLGREWRWNSRSASDKYRQIMKMFQDKKNSYFSIHQIASMGVSEGKQVGQWFGPNTVAQVLKKLVVYDEWSSLVIHVAMDNTVIQDDVKCLCKCKHGEDIDMCEIRGGLKPRKQMKGAEYIDCDSATVDKGSNSYALDPQSWKPLLLFIPLRLGLTETNVVYVESLKRCLEFKQSVGMIGGKPNHAHWFIGYVGDELVYLDPHTTHPSVDLDSPQAGDETFHCKYSSRMKIIDLDPSIALGFYCGTEVEFDDLCLNISKHVTCNKSSTMFELHKERPEHWPPFEPYLKAGAVRTSEFDVVDKQLFDTDDDFELVG